jgi:hypothetical protein
VQSVPRSKYVFEGKWEGRNPPCCWKGATYRTLVYITPCILDTTGLFTSSRKGKLEATLPLLKCLKTILCPKFVPRLIKAAEYCASDHPLLRCCSGRYLAKNHSQFLSSHCQVISTHLIRMHLRNPLHILYLDFIRQYQLGHSNLLPLCLRP